MEQKFLMIKKKLPSLQLPWANMFKTWGESRSKSCLWYFISFLHHDRPSTNRFPRIRFLDILPTFIVWHWHQPLFLFFFKIYVYIYIFYTVYWPDFMSVSVCMHACIPLSCDWLNDFLKGCRATISFWHLITVRSHRAPVDPLWYGPCTCSSPLSQVPIIIIKTPSPPPRPPNTHTHVSTMSPSHQF